MPMVWCCLWSPCCPRLWPMLVIQKSSPACIPDVPPILIGNFDLLEKEKTRIKCVDIPAKLVLPIYAPS